MIRYKLSRSEWDEFIQVILTLTCFKPAPGASLKSHLAGMRLRLVADCGAQVLFRRLPLGLTLAYFPKGPVGACRVAIWPELDRVCRAGAPFF